LPWASTRDSRPIKRNQSRHRPERVSLRRPVFLAVAPSILAGPPRSITENFFALCAFCAVIGEYFKPGATRPSSEFGSPVQFAFPDANERRSPGVGYLVPSSAPGVDCARQSQPIAFAA